MRQTSIASLRSGQLRRHLAAFAFTLALLCWPVLGTAQTEPFGERFGQWGFDLTGMNRTVRAGDSFYDYANGSWQEHTSLPPERPYQQMYTVANERLAARFRGLAEGRDGTRSRDLALVRALYGSFMEVGRTEELGAAPLAPNIQRIRQIRSLTDFARLAGESHGDFGLSPFVLSISPDAQDPTRNTVYVGQGGLGLDRAYYIDQQFSPQLAAYKTYITRQLALIDWPDPEASADLVIALEQRIAEIHWSPEQRTDSAAIYNPTTTERLDVQAPNFPWAAFFSGASLADRREIVVQEPSALQGTVSILSSTSIPALQAWSAFHLVDSAAPYMAEVFRGAHFGFHQSTLRGSSRQRERWRDGVELLRNGLPGALSRIYAERFLDRRAAMRVEAIADSVRSALEARIRRVSWMSAATKRAAVEKLRAMRVSIGFPARLPDHASLRFSERDLYGNLRAIFREQWAAKVRQLRSPVDTGAWPFPPYAVGASHLFSRNQAIFPAGFLQTPFFNASADEAVNYGAIGAMLGHEMSHAFDSMGRDYGPTGALQNWWQQSDREHFETLTARLVQQYGRLEYAPGQLVNGERTLVENTADIVGLAAAVDAYQQTYGGRETSSRDGFSGLQRVFLGFAQMWRAKFSDQLLNSIAATDYHAPARARVDGAVRNIDSWYRAFLVGPDDRLYLAPEDRITIW